MLKQQQRGVMLLEALIGVLLFSIGIIALMGMQASALANVSESKYRTEAAFLANEMVAEMNRNVAEVRVFNNANPTGMKAFPVTAANYNYSETPGNGGSAPTVSTAAGDNVLDWVARVKSTLPGNSALGPTITITPCVKGSQDAKCPNPFNKTGTVAYAAVAEITVRWKLPNSNTTRQHRTLTYFMYDALDS